MLMSKVRFLKADDSRNLVPPIINHAKNEWNNITIIYYMVDWNIF